MLALYVHFLTVFHQEDVVTDEDDELEEDDVVLDVEDVLAIVVFFGFGFTTGIDKSGCALSINPGILLALSSERFMKIS